MHGLKNLKFKFPEVVTLARKLNRNNLVVDE